MTVSQLDDAVSRSDPRLKEVWFSLRDEIRADDLIEVFPGEVDSIHLARIYRIRMRHLGERNIPIGGFEATVELLGSSPQAVRLVDIATPERNVIGFLRGDLKELIGLLWVPRYLENKDYTPTIPAPADLAA